MHSSCDHRRHTIHRTLFSPGLLFEKDSVQTRHGQFNHYNCCFDRGLFTPSVEGASYPIDAIGLYRDVWIAAIASSRTRLATLTGAMCKTSQCELRTLRVISGMLNVIRIETYYTLPTLESPDSFWIAMAILR